MALSTETSSKEQKPAMACEWGGEKAFIVLHRADGCWHAVTPGRNSLSIELFNQQDKRTHAVPYRSDFPNAHGWRLDIDRSSS